MARVPYEGGGEFSDMANDLFNQNESSNNLGIVRGLGGLSNPWGEMLDKILQGRNSKGASTGGADPGKDYNYGPGIVGTKKTIYG